MPADEKVRENGSTWPRSLIDNLTEPWNPEAFSDAYREALLGIVEKKVAGEPIEAPAEEAPARVVDLMEARRPRSRPRGKTPASRGGTKEVGREEAGRQAIDGQARHRREEAGAAEEGLRRVAAPPATPTDLS